MPKEAAALRRLAKSFSRGQTLQRGILEARGESSTLRRMSLSEEGTIAGGAISMDRGIYYWSVGLLEDSKRRIPSVTQSAVCSEWVRKPEEKSAFSPIYPARDIAHLETRPVTPRK